MASAYLQSADYPNYGVPNATAAQILQASVLIDAYLGRPAGLIWVPDTNGNPAYMQAMTPDFTLTASAAFGPGNGLTVPATGPLGMLQVGDCVVLDRANSALAESVQVTSINLAANTVTLGSTSVGQPIGVQFAHASGCTMDVGCLLTEQRYLPKARSEVTLGQAPVARVVGGTGRYSYGRRGDAAAYDMDNFNLLASLNKFGGPPAWEIWPANASAGIDSRTGRVWVPAGVMLAYYSEVKIRYVAGWTYATLPSEVKLACAQLITAMASNPMLGSVKSYKAGDTAVAQFAASAISDDVKAMINPYRARPFA